MSYDIMIDLETLGTTADAVILSIGAVQFDLDSRTVDDDLRAFYTTVSIDSQRSYGRRISANTLGWWLNQNSQARDVFVNNTNAPALEEALTDLVIFANIDAGPDTVWSNGADFDLPMLNHGYAQCGIGVPWPPYAARCYRTYKNLPGARDIKIERTGLHHNALDDAIYQARHLCAIHQALFVREVSE